MDEFRGIMKLFLEWNEYGTERSTLLSLLHILLAAGFLDAFSEFVAVPVYSFALC